MQAPALSIIDVIDRALEAERDGRQFSIENTLRRLTDELRLSLTREMELLAQRKEAGGDDVAVAAPVIEAAPHEAMVPNLSSSTGRDPRGSFVIVRELIARAGPRGIFQSELDARAEEFGFTKGAIARAKQRLREDLIVTFDGRWRVWRCMTSEEVLAAQADRAGKAA